MKIWSFKRWFNDRYWNYQFREAMGGRRGRRLFTYELCGHPWCWRFANYDHRCLKHQGDP